MAYLRRFFLRVFNVFRPGRAEPDLTRELMSHLTLLEDDFQRRGMTPEEAQLAARRAFGGVEQTKELHRDARSFRWLDDARQDLQYGVRGLRRMPGFSTVAVLSLALGIGANTAIFSIMEAALWKAIPVHEPEQLRLFSWVSGPRTVMNSTWGNWRRVATGGRTSTSFSYIIFQGLQQQDAAFDSVFAFKPIGRVTATVNSEADLVIGHLVSGNFYDGVGVKPIVGRSIVPADDVGGRTEVVAVISDGFWARRFGRDMSVVGKQIRINQVPVTIVGVNPREFTGVEPGQHPDIFMPLTAQPVVLPWRYAKTGSLLDDPDYWWVLVMGRLKSGVSQSQAQSAMEVAFRQTVRASLPDRADRDQPTLRLLTGSRGLDNLREEFARPLLVLVSFVALVLLIVCANLAILLLARAEGRRRELSLRLALGAGRWRITRQLLTEGLTLGVGGGVLGLLFGYWTRDAIPGLLVPSWMTDLQFKAEFDSRVLLLAFAVTLVTSVVFSIAPVWQSSRVEIGAALKDGGRLAMNVVRPLRGKSLVVLQVCLSVLLLIGAGLFVRTLSSLRSVSLGFQPDRILLFAIDPPRARYAGHSRNALFEQLQKRIGAIPGVQASSLSEEPLMGGGSSTTRVGPDGRAAGPKDQAWVNDVGWGFFETMGIPIIFGRSFDVQDREDSPPVVVVNQQFVLEFFPNDNPLGRTLRNNNLLYHIVGVCGDTHFDRARKPVPPTFYRLFTQGRDHGALTFEVRTSTSTAAIMNSIRQVVRAVDKDLPIFDVRTQTEQINATLSRERLFVTLTSAFGVLALVLASVGIYGLMAYSVSRRTSEIGIRMALGAERRTVLLMILREASTLAAIGVALGVAAATGLSRYIQSMLFGVQPVDLITIATAVAAMMTVAFVAGWWPARRASHLDPTVALRHE